MIVVAEPNLTGKEQEYVADAIASGHVGPDGPYVERFEEMVAKAAGREWAVATTTGTAALHAAATVLGFTNHDVSIPREAFPAARNVLWGLGCGIEYFNGGTGHDRQVYSYQPWPTLCDRAPAIGETDAGGTLDCYSFNANKTVTTGQGGAIVGDSDSLHAAVVDTVKQGHGRKGIFNYRMANLNAAVGCAQMHRLDEFREAKKRIWDRYAEHFNMVERGQSRWMATIDKGILLRLLGGEGIEGRYEKNIGVSLPCSTNLTEEDQDKVIKCVASL